MLEEADGPTCVHVMRTKTESFNLDSGRPTWSASASGGWPRASGTVRRLNARTRGPVFSIPTPDLLGSGSRGPYLTLRNH